MTRVQNRIAAGLIATALVAILAGCDLTTEAPTTSASPEPTPVVTVTPTETAEPVVVPLSVPGCDTLLTLAQVRSVLAAPTAVLIAEEPANTYTPWYYDPKPSVVSAISGLTVARMCWWGVQNSGYGFTVLVGEIDGATRASIEAALPAAGFSATTLGARTVYGIESDDNDTAETHQFIGDVWILSNGPDLDITGVAADHAYAAMVAANPGLGL
jgi:hypothetical protein